jgi:hypothetical protein
MTTISLLFIGGMIDPPQHLVNCALEKRYRRNSPQAQVNIADFSTEALMKSRDNFDSLVSESPDFWNLRMITHVATSPLFLSVTFIPSNLKAKSTWFVQKYSIEPPFIGFLSPSVNLSDKMRAEWGCVDKVDQLDEIRCEEDIEMSISGIDPIVQFDIKTLLSYFLKDSSSILVGLTYLDNSCSPTTRFWNKA